MRRSQREQDLEILLICRNPNTFYSILRKANIPYMVVQTKVASLARRGLVLCSMNGRSQSVVDTQKGLEVLEAARKLSELLGA